MQYGNQLHRKKSQSNFWKKTKKILYRVTMTILLCIFAYASFMLYQELHKRDDSKKVTKQFQEKVVKEEKNIEYLDPDWDALKQMNPDIVAWIYVPDCNINFPVVQRKDDNSYYLTRNAYKYKDEFGAIFLDGSAPSDFTDLNSIIYGHSVIGGGMFTNIKNFKDSSFFEAHPYFYLLTPEQNYRCSIYAFAKTTSDSVFYTTQPGLEDLNKMASSAMYNRTLKGIHWKGLSDPEASGKNFITLSTCNLDYGLGSNQRYVLTGLMKNYNKKIKVVD